MNEDLGIKYFYNENVSGEADLIIKQQPNDFIVQEVTDDKVCGFGYIVDIEKIFKGINFLSYVSTLKGGFIDVDSINLEIEEPFNYSLTNLTDKNNHKCGFVDFLDQCNLDKINLTISKINILDLINLELLEDIKAKWEMIKQTKIEIDCSGEENKTTRTRIHKILGYIPMIDTKTVDGKIVILHDTEGVYRAVAAKSMYNSMDICSKINNYLQLKNGKVGISGNKDKQAVTFQEISIGANFNCIFELAYEWYDDRIVELLNRNYDDSLNKFFQKDFVSAIGEDLHYLKSDRRPITLKQFHLINLSIYLIIKYLQSSIIDKELFIAIRNKIEALIDAIDDDHTDTERCKSQIYIYNIKRGDIKRLGDLKGNKFTIKLNNTKEINGNTKFLNYFGMQRFGKNKNNHLIGEKILNKDYKGAVKMIMENSRGYKAFKGLERDADPKDVLSPCDSLEKHVFRMKLKGKSDKDIVYSLRRETRMIYLHAYQSFIFNEALNEEVEKAGDNRSTLDNLMLPLAKFNDKMLKGGERMAVAECYNLVAYPFKEDFIVSFYLKPSSYATLALREMCSKIKQ